MVGLELFGEVALLRSLAVASSRRGSGLGSRLVAHAERHARDQGVQSLFLLTTTAEKFFLRRGYTRIPRDEAPAAIKGTREFSGICPASSAFMVKNLDDFVTINLWRLVPYRGATAFFLLWEWLPATIIAVKLRRTPTKSS